jgi:MFS family permease
MEMQVFHRHHYSHQHSPPTSTLINANVVHRTWTASVSQFEQLVVARFIVGLTVGVISMSVPVYIGEIAPTHLR